MANNRYNRYPFNNQNIPSPNKDSDDINEVYEIPLPNEIDVGKKPIDTHQEQRGSPFSIPNFLKNIQVEELILLFLILLFLFEGVNDEIIIILFLYILFWEKFFN